MSNAKDLTGEKIGKLVLLERKRENKRTYYYCQCECGNNKWIRADALKTTRSCGCLAKETQFAPSDLTHKVFGRLTAIKPTDKRDTNGSIFWLCICDCGKTKEVSTHNLERGGVRSCSCLSLEIHSKIFRKAIKAHLEKHIVHGTNLQMITRKKLLPTNTSGYTGVKWSKSRKKWLAEIQFKSKIYYLGSYKDKEDAINARKEAEEKIHGEFLEWYHKHKEKK